MYLVLLIGIPIVAFPLQNHINNRKFNLNIKIKNQLNLQTIKDDNDNNSNNNSHKYELVQQKDDETNDYDMFEIQPINHSDISNNKNIEKNQKNNNKYIEHCDGSNIETKIKPNNDNNDV